MAFLGLLRACAQPGHAPNPACMHAFLACQEYFRTFQSLCGHIIP